MYTFMCTFVNQLLHPIVVFSAQPSKKDYKYPYFCHIFLPGKCFGNPNIGTTTRSAIAALTRNPSHQAPTQSGLSGVMSRLRVIRIHNVYIKISVGFVLSCLLQICLNTPGGVIREVIMCAFVELIYSKWCFI